MKLFQNRPGVSEQIFKEFLYVRIVQKFSPPPPWRPCFSTDQNCENNFWKGLPKEQSCEIISKSDKQFQRRWILKNFSEGHKKASPHGSHVFRRIKISRKMFEKGHTRNNPVKLFQILTSSFGEDFLRTFSCLFSAKVSPHTAAMFSTDQNFANTFWKGSPKEHSCEIISKSDQGFQRRRFFKNFFMSI